MRTLLFSAMALALCFSSACDGGDAEDTGATSATSGDGDGDGDGDEGGVCGEEWASKDPMSGEPPLQPVQGFGAPCETDADCTEIAGGAGSCVTEILGMFEVPNGICTITDCTVPSDTFYVPDSTECSDMGGIDCVGIVGNFTACLPTCSNNDQCNREGYGCRLMPLIGAENDPTYCLMDAQDCCLLDTPEQCGS